MTLSLCYWADNIQEMGVGAWPEIELLIEALDIADVDYELVKIDELDKKPNPVYLVNLANYVNLHNFYPALINIEVLRLVKQRKVKLVFIYTHEIDEGDATVQGIHRNTKADDFALLDGISRLIRQFILPEDMIYLLANNRLALYKSEISPCHQMDFATAFKYMILHSNTEQYIKESELDSNVIREHRYICLNHKPSFSRDHLLNYLHDSDLLKYGKVSCIESFGNMKSETEALLPLIVDEEVNQHKGENREQRINFDYLYRDVYFSVVTETYFKYENNLNSNNAFSKVLDVSFFTEKTFMPMLQLCPTIILANPGHLARLRKLGFKTFHPFINERYDVLTDGQERFDAIFAEISRLCSMSDDEINKWYYDMLPILVHNQQHLLNNHAEIEFIVEELLR